MKDKVILYRGIDFSTDLFIPGEEIKGIRLNTTYQCHDDYGKLLYKVNVILYKNGAEEPIQALYSVDNYTFDEAEILQEKFRIEIVNMINSEKKVIDIESLYYIEEREVK